MINIFRILEPDRPNPGDSEQKLLWYPWARIPPLRMKTRGAYRKNYPIGAVVHYTAGHSLSSALDHGRELGYCYFVIDIYGETYQSFPLNEWGYHCGESYSPKLGGSLSQDLVGIELVCAGELVKKQDTYLTWFNKEIPQERVRAVEQGYFEKFTLDQENALERLLLWLKDNNPEVFMIDNILGHFEISPKRKKDPGGSLSISMDELRLKIRKKYNEQYQRRQV